MSAPEVEPSGDYVGLTEAECDALGWALCDCNDPECLVRMDYRPETLWPAVERIIAGRVAAAKAEVVADVESVLDGYDFAGNALAKAVCEGYRDMIRARLALSLTSEDSCDNYRAPVTCLTAPSSEAGRCDHCAARAPLSISPGVSGG